MKNIILISVFNGEEFIEKQINSIIISSNNYETVIVSYDDRSKDESINILKSFQDKIDIIFLESKCFNHVSRNFIYLLEYSLGKFGPNNIFYFCDQDDIWDEKKVEVTNKYFLNSNSPLFLSAVKHFGMEDKVLIPDVKRFVLFDFIFNVAPGMSFAFVPSRFNKDLYLLKLFKWHDHGLFLFSKIFGPAPIVSRSVLQYYRRHRKAYMKQNKFGFLKRIHYFLSNILSFIKIIFYSKSIIK